MSTLSFPDRAVSYIATHIKNGTDTDIVTETHYTHFPQVLAGKLRLILLRGPLGNCVVTGDFDPAKLEETLVHFTTAAQAQTKH